MNKRIDKKIKYFLIYAIIVGVTLIILNFIRAAKTGISYDESFTYLHYVSDNPFRSFKYLFNTEEVLANNHLINSFAIALFDKIFHTEYNILIIRLPNLLSYIVYFVFAYLISKKYRHNYLCFNILAFNLGVHEMFGIARGYGIACSFVIAALYYLIKWYEDSSNYNYLNMTYFLLMISCYANTVCLMVFASIIIFTQGYLLIKKGIKENINYILKKWYVILPVAIITIIIILYHFKVSAEGLPLYGGKDNFFNSVLVSSVNIYGINSHAKICTILLLCLLGLLCIIYRKRIIKDYLVYLSLFYFGLLIILTLFFNQMWLTGRLLIPVMPLLSISIMEIIDMVDNKIMVWFILVITILPFMKNFKLYEAREIKNDYYIEKKAYEAYYKKDNNIIRKELSHNELYFYRNKILKENGYDIFDGIPLEEFEKFN